MKTLITKAVLFAALLFAANFTAFPQKAVNLKYQMPEGKTYRYKTLVASDITQEAMGQQMKINNEVFSVTRVVVDSRGEDGNLNLIISSDSITVRNKMQGRDTTISLSSLLGKRTKLEISQYGDIINKTIIDSLSGKEQMMESSILQSATSLYTKLPGKEIKEGDNWKYARTDTIASMGGQLIINSNYIYTLNGTEDKDGIKCYKIPYTAEMTSTGNSNMQGMNFYIDGSGKMTGTLYISADDGSVVSVEGKNESNMTLATTGDQKMVIPVSQSSTVQTDLISN